MLDFLPNQLEQRLQLCVMLRRDVSNHERQKFQILCVFLKLPHP